MDMSLRTTGKFTTHFIKKSAVLFATWGGACVVDLMKACRHKNVQTLETYAQDAKMMLEIAISNEPDTMATIPKFHPVVIHDTDAALLHNEASYGAIVDLSHAVKMFESVIGFQEGHPKQFHSITMFAKALQYVPPMNAMDSLKSLIQVNVPHHIWKTIACLFK